MGFRRQKDSVRRSIDWSRFRLNFAELFERTALPARVCESKDHFDYFLMHGYLDHYERPYPFSVRDLDDSQRSALRELVVSYLVAGFDDPGLGLFGSAEHDEIRAETETRK